MYFTVYAHRKYHLRETKLVFLPVISHVQGNFLYFDNNDDEEYLYTAFHQKVIHKDIYLTS